MNGSPKIHLHARNPTMTWLKAIELFDGTTKARDKKVSMGDRELEPKLKREWKWGKAKGIN
jgi:hypothetical protein